jgi:cell division protein FtsW (lipid II flippase)
MSATPTTSRRRTPDETRTERVAISRTALVAAWVLLAAGILLALVGQPVLGGLALLGAVAASVASLDGFRRVRWVTLAASVLALVALIVADLVLAPQS